MGPMFGMVGPRADGGARLCAGSDQLRFESPDGRFVCVVDGRLAHYDDAAERFRRRGVEIRSLAPAEAIVRYYAHDGIESFRLLRGAFAFAVWDTRESRLVLCADSVGTKRLYYSLVDGGIVFSTDLAALVRTAEVERRISNQGLLEYLSFGFVHTPHTIYESVSVIATGRYLEFRDGAVSTGFYDPHVPSQWDPLDTSDCSEEDLVDRMDALVIDSVRSRLPDNDDTVAAYLSSGLDTGLLATILKRRTDRRIAAFTLGSEDPAWDEAPGARRLAEHLGIDRHECYYIREEDCFGSLPHIVESVGQPIADISVIPTFAIAKQVSQAHSLVFTGDGPDGLFGNWDLRPWYYYYKFVPRFLRAPLARFADTTDSLFGLKLSTPSRHISELLTQPEFAWVYHKKLKSADLESALGKPVSADTFELARYLRERTDIPLYERLRIAFSLYFVSYGVLQKSAAAHSACGLDQVCPYYDYEIMRFISSLPTRYKIRGVGFGKYLHKKLFSRYVPPEIWKGRKQGFIVDLKQFGVKPLRELTDYYLDGSRLDEAGLFNSGFVLKCVNDYYAGVERMGPIVFTFLMFEIWRDTFNPT